MDRIGSDPVCTICKHGIDANNAALAERARKSSELGGPIEQVVVAINAAANYVAQKWVESAVESLTEMVDSVKDLKDQRDSDSPDPTSIVDKI